MGKRKRKPLSENEKPLTTTIVWGLVILAALTAVIWLSHKVKTVNHPAEYEGVIVDKWAGYWETDEGSRPYFRLLVELQDGRKLTVRVQPNLYQRARVGSKIRKSSNGLELTETETIKSG